MVLVMSGCCLEKGGIPFIDFCLAYNGCYLLILGVTMQTSATQQPRSVGSVTIKLDVADRERIATLAIARKRTPHYLMKEAILEYVKKEEARQNFITAAQTSFLHYQQTGIHITLDEFSSWVDQVQLNPAEPMPVCHT